MKKYFFVAALAVSVPLCGCNKAGKINQESTYKAPTGPVEFKLKWPQGERVEQDIDIVLKSTITAPGMPAPMQQDGTMGMSYGLTVLQAGQDGTHEIEMDFLSSKMTMKMGDRVLVDYDSAKKADPNAKDPVSQLFGKIIGSKVQYYLDASNAVERIGGVDEMMARLSTGANPQDMAALKSMFSEGYLKQMMSANLMLPPHAVQPGDTWPVQLEFPMGPLGTMVVNYNFTFRNWEMHGKRECARLEFDGTVSTKNAEPKAGQMTMTIHDGTAAGTSWFDPDLGITIDTSVSQNFKMTMQVPTGGQAAKMQSVEDDMQQTMSIKLVSVK